MMIAALSFIVVGCFAFPLFEDGTECLKNCFYPKGMPISSDVEIDYELSESHVHAFFKRGLFSSKESIESDRCESVSEFAVCARTCPRCRLDSVAQQRTEIVLKSCASSRPEADRKAFLKSTGELSRTLFMRAMSCPLREHDGDEGVCRDTASCSFGSSLYALKKQYPADVVATATDEWEVILAFALKDPKSHNRPTCSALFEPHWA